MKSKNKIQQIVSEQLVINRLVRGDIENKTFARDLERLTKSIQSRGIMTPLLVCSTKDGFTIIDGNRRFEAGLAAGLKEFPCILKEIEQEDKDDAITLLGFSTNEMRSDLKPSQEIEALQKVLNEGELTLEAIASATGKSISQLKTILARKNLDKKVINLIDKGDIAPSASNKLVPLEKKEQLEVLSTFKGLGIPVSGETINLYRGKNTLDDTKISRKVKKKLIENIGLQADEINNLKEEYYKIEKNLQKSVKLVKKFWQNEKVVIYLRKSHPLIYDDFEEILESIG